MSTGTHRVTQRRGSSTVILFGTEGLREVSRYGLTGSFCLVSHLNFYSLNFNNFSSLSDFYSLNFNNLSSFFLLLIFTSVGHPECPEVILLIYTWYFKVFLCCLSLSLAYTSLLSIFTIFRLFSSYVCLSSLIYLRLILFDFLWMWLCVMLVWEFSMSFPLRKEFKK